MNPESEKCLSDIDQLIDNAKRLQEAAQSELCRAEHLGKAEINATVRRIRWQLVDLFGKAPIPGEQFLVSEAIYQLKGRPGNKNFCVMKYLDDETFLETCYRLLVGREPESTIEAWCKSIQQQKGLPVWGSNSSFNRFTIALRKQYDRLRRLYTGAAGLPVVEESTQGKIASQGV